jgi:pyruvate/2-oxoglutarate/acetoin dehydrogenase E1 component
VPGLRVCLPSTPQDAHDLLLSAVACDDPTLVVEARALYNGSREPVTVDGPVAPIGGSRHRHHGDDVTVVSWGAQTRNVLAAAAELAAEGIGVDVIETVWLNPFDTPAVLDSVARTGRLLVVHEANVTGGFGAEVLARVAESGVALRAPARRLGLPDLRVPAAPALSAAVLPSTAGVADAVRAMISANAPAQPEQYSAAR